MKHLKQLREEHGISQQKLADIVGISQQSIYKYEKDLAEPDFETLIKLAEYFGTSIDFIIGHTDIKRKYEHLNDELLSDDEKNFIFEYRKLPNRMKTLMMSYIDEYNKK